MPSLRRVLRPRVSALHAVSFSYYTLYSNRGVRQLLFRFRLGLVCVCLGRCLGCLIQGRRFRPRLPVLPVSGTLFHCLPTIVRKEKTVNCCLFQVWCGPAAVTRKLEYEPATRSQAAGPSRRQGHHFCLRPLPRSFHFGFCKDLSEASPLLSGYSQPPPREGGGGRLSH